MGGGSIETSTGFWLDPLPLPTLVKRIALYMAHNGWPLSLQNSTHTYMMYITTGGVRGGHVQHGRLRPRLHAREEGTEGGVCMYACVLCVWVWGRVCLPFLSFFIDSTPHPLTKTLLAHIPTQLGEGAFGQVFLCVHRKSRQKCAVKIVDTSKLNVDDARHLEDEIDILKVRRCGGVVAIAIGRADFLSVLVGFLRILEQQHHATPTHKR